MKVSTAKEKVCPFIYNNQNSDLGNDGGHINCITDKCMAWIETKGDIHTFDAKEAKWACPEGYEFIEYNANGHMLCYETGSFGYCSKIESC